MTTQLETQIPLKDAARKYGVPVRALTRLVQDGIIRLARTEEGDSVITASTVDNDTAVRIILEEIHPEQYEHLHEKRIRLSEAADKYGVDVVSLSGWVDRGYVRVCDRGPKLLEIDEADVAYIAAIFKRGRELTGSSIKTGWVIKRLFEKD